MSDLISRQAALNALEAFMNECAREMGLILKEMAQNLCIELGLIKPRHKYHTKRVAVRKMQLRRIRHEISIYIRLQGKKSRQVGDWGGGNGNDLAWFGQDHSKGD